MDSATAGMRVGAVSNRDMDGKAVSVICMNPNLLSLVSFGQMVGFPRHRIESS